MILFRNALFVRVDHADSAQCSSASSNPDRLSTAVCDRKFAFVDWTHTNTRRGRRAGRGRRGGRYALRVAVGAPEAVEVGVRVGVGPPVAVAVGVGDALGVMVGVGFVPPTTQILAGSMQALPLNFVRLTTLLL